MTPLALTVLVVVAVLFLIVAVLRRRTSGRVRQALGVVYDSNSAEAMRRDFAGALTRRVAPGVYRPGGILMRGKAAKHFGLLGRTLLVHADPSTVAAMAGPAMEAANPRFIRCNDFEVGEVAAWEVTSSFGLFPRVVVRASPLFPRVTEIGATRFKMSMRFPQGGPFVDRAISAALDAVNAARIPVTEQVRDSALDPSGPPGVDGVWLAGSLSALDPGARKAS